MHSLSPSYSSTRSTFCFLIKAKDRVSVDHEAHLVSGGARANVCTRQIIAAAVLSQTWGWALSVTTYATCLHSSFVSDHGRTPRHCRTKEFPSASEERSARFGRTRDSSSERSIIYFFPKHEVDSVKHTCQQWELFINLTTMVEWKTQEQLHTFSLPSVFVL